MSEVLYGQCQVPKVWIGELSGALPVTTEELNEDDPAVLSMAGPRDFCVSMSCHGSMKDCAAVLIVSCALTKHCELDDLA